MKKYGVFRKFRWLAALVVTLALVVAVTGCSENDGKVANMQEGVADVTQLSKEEVVKQRAQEHMDALIAMDWKKAYEFLSPARRSLKPFEVYANRMKGGAIIRKTATVEKVECEEALCKADILLGYLYVGDIAQMRGQEMTSRFQEKWIFSDGNWWVSPD
ncbi:hypothetical protein [Thiolapillus sp.]